MTMDRERGRESNHSHGRPKRSGEGRFFSLYMFTPARVATYCTTGCLFPNRELRWRNLANLVLGVLGAFHLN